MSGEKTSPIVQRDTCEGHTIFSSSTYPGKFFVLSPATAINLRSTGASGVPDVDKYNYFDTIEDIHAAIWAAKIRGDAL